MQQATHGHHEGVPKWRKTLVEKETRSVNTAHEKKTQKHTLHTLQILSFVRYSFSWRCLKTQQNDWNLDDQDNV